MATELRDYVEANELSPAQVTTKTRLIYDTVLEESPYLDGGNFTTIDATDLKRLFDHYDAIFFKSHIEKTLGKTLVHFRLSPRMTRAGGRTAQVTPARHPGRQYYEISVSTALLLDSFAGADHRPVTVTGLTCRDRMEAIQRILEHEVIHLIELLVWETSRCSSTRFQSMASRFFGHTTHTHALITPGERAAEQFGITPGDHVRFRFRGGVYTGVVNRITKRATVLVRNQRGRLYTDGSRYSTFYVPVERLETLPAPRSHE